jgi:hypothetical protein
MKLALAIIAGLLLVFTVAGSASGSGDILTLVALPGVVLGGVGALFLGSAPRKPSLRFMAGAFVGVAATFALFAMRVGTMSATAAGSLAGIGLVNWALLGGCCVLILRALPPLRPAPATPPLPDPAT